MHTPVAAQPNFAIEGVGMNYQFPFNIGGGEWNTPGFTCKCYSSKDTVRYLWNEQFNGVFPIDSCYKKERIKQWAIGVNDNKKDPTIFFVNNSLSLRTAYAINYKVYNSIGALVLSEKSASHYYEKDLSYLPAGIYIVHLKFKNERLVKKILIN